MGYQLFGHFTLWEGPRARGNSPSA
jgi:hypothetical protein